MKWCQCLCSSETEVEVVTSLDLSCSSLTEVPSTVFNLERTLQTLYLNSNKIIDLPRTLFQCEELRFLSLPDNEIRKIPTLIEKLSNLETLLLSSNCLTNNSIPNSIHKCQNLKILDLSFNSLTAIPISITRLISLLELHLNNCDIDFLPANFGRLGNLKILELRENSLDTLPKSLKRLTLLQRLDLSSNAFTDIPEVVGCMLNLTELWVNDNDINEISNVVASLAMLAHFDASYNQITKVADGIGACINLNLLILTANDIEYLPESIGSLTLLHTLKLDYNKLLELPNSIGNLQNLEELDVQYNALKTLPNTIGRLKKLNSLVASQNYLKSIPNEIGRCTSLSVLALNYNHLTCLPDEIGQLENLTAISLVSNRLKNLPVTMLNLLNLKALWLSYNQIRPLIILQRELDAGKLVLTCVFLPQIQETIRNRVEPEPSSNQTTRRRIAFIEPDPSDLPSKLNRIPTPHPKSLVKYQEKILANSSRKQEIPQNVSIPSPVSVKEANVVYVCMNKKEMEHVYENKTIDEEKTYELLEDDVKNKSACLENGCNNKLTENETYPMDGAKPKQPPPYHIAAVYSRGAHLFLRTDRETEPKKFTQDKPANILNPQPKHARLLPEYEYNERYELADKILNVSYNLIELDPTVYKELIYKFLQLNPKILQMKAADKTANCHLIEVYTQILKTTAYLLGSNNTIFKDKLLRVEAELKDVQTDQTDKFDVYDKEVRDKLDVVKFISRLLTEDEPEDVLSGLIMSFICFDNFLPSLVNKRVLFEKGYVAYLKLFLIEVVIYFLSLPNNAEYEYILETVLNLKNLNPSQEQRSNRNVKEQKPNINWLFGAHKNPRIIKVELTPCCYVLGFSVKCNEEGVFVDEIDKDGNAFNKLYTGDKILMLDDRDITKMDPEEALKAVQMWGPETEVFLISRL